MTGIHDYKFCYEFNYRLGTNFGHFQAFSNFLRLRQKNPGKFFMYTAGTHSQHYGTCTCFTSRDVFAILRTISVARSRDQLMGMGTQLSGSRGRCAI